MKRIYALLFVVLLGGVYSCNNEEKNDSDVVSIDDAQSIEDYTSLIEKNPDNADLYNERALLYLKNNDAEKAKDDIREALRINPNSSEYLVTRAKIYASTVEMERSLRDFKKATEIDSNNAEAFLGIGKIYYLARNPEIAMENLDRALKLDPYQKEPYFYKGMIFKEYNDFKSAASSFQTALEQDPEYYDAYVELGILYSGIKKPIALEYFESALRIDSMGVDAHYAKAKYFQDVDSIDVALSHYKKIIENVDSTFSPAYFNQGYIQMMVKEDYDSAVYFFNKALEVDPEYVQAHHNIGLIYQMAGDKNKAKNHYKKALEIDNTFQLSRDALKNLDK